MSLRVWLPLVNDLNNYGSSDLTFTTIDNYSSINSAGKLGKCLYNESNDTYHTTGGVISDKPIDLGQNQSMFCWFKFDTLTSAASLGGCVMSQHRYTTCTGMGITIAYVDSTHGYISANTGNGDKARTYNTYTGSTLLSAGIWYHGGYTFDGSTLRFYINGDLDGEYTNLSLAVPSDYLMLASWSLAGESGGVIYDGGYKFDGRINDARFYDHCLSIKEIKEIAKGLIVHYPLDGGTSTSSTTEYDTSGNKYNGTVTGTLTYEGNSIRYNSASLCTDGINNYISAPILMASDEITMNLWIKSKTGAAGSGNYHIPLVIGGANYELSIDSTGKFRNGFVLSGTRVVETTNSKDIISDMEWHMITATYDGSSIKRYVDGELVSTQSASGTLVKGQTILWLGRYETNSAYGDVELYKSDVRVYATPLSADDIKELYQTSTQIDNTGKLYTYQYNEI